METIVYDSILKINKNKWNNIVKCSRTGWLFHRYEWLKAVEKGVGLGARHIVVYDKSGNILGLLPNFAVNVGRLPFNNYISITPGFGGPVVISREEEATRILLNRAAKFSGVSSLSHMIIVLRPEYLRYSVLMIEHGYETILKNCSFRLRLEKGWEYIEKQMCKKRRNRLRKAEKFDYEIFELNASENNLRRFYNYYRNTINRVGGKPYPYEFFRILGHEMNNNIKIFMINIDGHECGGYFYINDDEKGIIMHTFSGVPRDCFKYNAPELLHAHVIRWSIEKGYIEYNFGGTTADFRNGTFRFKEEFGGEIVPIIIWRKIYSKTLWNIYRLGKILKNRKM